MSKVRQTRSSVWVGLAMVVLILPVLTSEVVLAGGGGRCLSVDVDSPIRLPNGELHPSGRLTLCSSLKVTPVSTLHNAYVNGRLTGMLLADRRSSEARDASSPVVFFYRTGEGHLELYGYTLPSRSGSVTYRLGERRQVPARPAEIAKRSRQSSGRWVALSSVTP